MTAVFPVADPDPEPVVRQAASRAIKSRGLGRLGGLAGWLADVQGGWPPRVPRRIRLLAVAGPDGPAGVASGTALLAAHHDVGVRVLSVPEAVEDPVGVGRRMVDEEVDAGADLLLVASIGDDDVATAVTVALLTDTEPVDVVGFGGGARRDDAEWMRLLCAVRDGCRQARWAAHDPAGLLATVHDGRLPVLCGVLGQAGVRRTPVVLDGAPAAAAALAAARLTPAASRWWQAGSRPEQQAGRLALDRLELTPLLNLDLRAGDGSGALLAVPLIAAAVAAAVPPDV